MNFKVGPTAMDGVNHKKDKERSRTKPHILAVTIQ